MIRPDQVMLLVAAANYKLANLKQMIYLQFFSSFELRGIAKHLMTGPVGNSEFCFPLISMVSALPQETLRVSGKQLIKTHRFPWGQAWIFLSSFMIFFLLLQHYFYHKRKEELQNISICFIKYCNFLVCNRSFSLYIKPVIKCLLFGNSANDMVPPLWCVKTLQFHST